MSVGRRLNFDLNFNDRREYKIGNTLVVFIRMTTNELLRFFV